MERPGRGKGALLLKNQPYDESLEVADPEEVASVYSTTPRGQRQVTRTAGLTTPQRQRQAAPQ